MGGHGQLISSPGGRTREVIVHDVKHALAGWLGNTALLYGALSAGLPQRFMSSTDGNGMSAAKMAAVFELVVATKQALARMGIQLPASMYGSGGGGY